ncbi:protease inhibitor I42 family protein [Candidatus Binatia bacterium]|nr:protease inhibitor I42 family protein [Candidatus Binatia bacterium]
MSRTRTARLPAILLAATLGACSLFASEPGPPPAEIAATPGKDFSITLDANHTTGFQWELAKPLDGSVLTLVETTYEEQPNGAPGTGGKEVWTFAPVAPGWTKIELVYRRPWEDMAPARIAVYAVDVE